MVNKRPYDDEESCEPACKHQRQLEYSKHLASIVEIVPCRDSPQKHHTSGVGGFCKFQDGERVATDTATDFSIGTNKDFETSAPDTISNLLRFTNCTIEEYARSEMAVCASFSLGYLEPNHPTRTLVQSEENYSVLLHYPPRKRVPIGEDHQAHVPVWGLQSIKNASSYIDKSDPDITFPQSSGSNFIVNEGNREEFMGTCVISMPDLEHSAYYDDGAGKGGTDCNCPDGGSVRCVRQHVKEARENLRGTLGQENFVELGFSEMGEEVAQKWSEEEEQIFHEVVFSNAATLGKNFWDHLSVVFPSRTKKDLVCYYFNVFILRRRAEQNRSYPLNIDSDNDEWQESDDGDDEPGITEEDEDSVMESLVERKHPVYNQNDHEDEGEDEDDDDDDDEDEDEDEDETYNNDDEDEGGVDDVSEAHIGKSLGDCSFHPVDQLSSKTEGNGGEEHNVQDDSCTSYERHPSGAEPFVPVDLGADRQGNRVWSDHSKHFQGGYDMLSGGVDHGYILEPSDAKVWDIGYLIGPKKDVDFLPTCNMIKEIFGDESWNNNARNGKGIS